MNSPSQSKMHRGRRPYRIYAESLSALSADYAELTLRLIDLDVTSIQSLQAIERVMGRLGPHVRDARNGRLPQACPA